jgi:glucose-fructose oxidoreductase
VFGFTAYSCDPRFRDVPEAVAAMLHFPDDRLATFTCGFGHSKVSSLRVVGRRGDVRLEPAFSHDGELKRYVTIDGTTTEETFPARDQVGPEILYFSHCILTDQTPEPDGVEGWRDVSIIEAIRESIRLKRPVPRERDFAYRRPDADQMITLPEVKEPPLVKADAPQG